MPRCLRKRTSACFEEVACSNGLRVMCSSPFRSMDDQRPASKRTPPPFTSTTSMPCSRLMRTKSASPSPGRPFRTDCHCTWWRTVQHSGNDSSARRTLSSASLASRGGSGGYIIAIKVAPFRTARSREPRFASARLPEADRAIPLDPELQEWWDLTRSSPR